MLISNLSGRTFLSQQLDNVGTSLLGIGSGPLTLLAERRDAVGIGSIHGSGDVEESQNAFVQDGIPQNVGEKLHGGWLRAKHALGEGGEE